jgi:hypothetical protein
METMFSVWSVPRCYKQVSLKQRSSCWLELSVDQLRVTSTPIELSDVKYLVCQRASSVESQPMKRGLGGWCEMAASLGACYLSCQLTRILHGRLWQENLSAGNWRNSLGRSRCQETASGDCNRPRTLVCVCHWSVKCSSEWCIQVVNKSNIQSMSRLYSHAPKSWQYR